MTTGKWMATILLAAMTALAAPQTVLAQAQGDTQSAPAEPAPAPKKKYVALGDDYPAQFSLFCAGGAALGVGGAYLAGPTEAVLLFGGGLLTASSNSLLLLSLLGQIGASACVMGGTVAPTVLWTMGESDKLWAKFKRELSNAGDSVMQASTSALSAVGLAGAPSGQVAEAASAAAP